MSFFRVTGVRGLNGLMVEGNPGRGETGPDVEIVRLINRNAIIGDRNISIPVDPGMLFIHESALEEIENPETREFGSDNPWGQCLFEGHYTKTGLDIAYARFERCTQVTVTEKVGGVSKTLYSGYFTSDDVDFQDVQGTIEMCLEDQNSGVDDLIFQLNELPGMGRDV